MLELLAVGTVALAVGYALGRVRSSRPTTRPGQEIQSRRAQRPECTACGSTFADVASAREHARDTHNAPSEAAENYLIDTGERA